MSGAIHPSALPGRATGGRGPPFASLALDVTSEPWGTLGLGQPQLGAAAAGGGSGNPSDDMAFLVDRVVALLLVRIVALLSFRKGGRNTTGGPTVATTGKSDAGSEGAADHAPEAPRINYSDLSTTTIARAALASDWTEWPESEVTPELLKQLREYVMQICSKYWASVHYHNLDHCYHVVISANKLLDMILCEDDWSNFGQQAAAAAGHAESNGGGASASPRKKQWRRTFGIKSDPLAQLAFVFSALIHDVEHMGLTNQQLVDESNELAILYNDQSVAEQRSLAVAFATLMRPEFAVLREALFPTREDYVRFRKLVINLVLCTDIASPERQQIVKSKWKEAFGAETTAAAARAREREQKRRRSRAATREKQQQQAKALREQQQQHQQQQRRGDIRRMSSPATSIQDVQNEEIQGLEREPNNGEKDEKLVSRFFRNRLSMNHAPAANLEGSAHLNGVSDHHSVPHDFVARRNSAMSETDAGDDLSVSSGSISPSLSIEPDQSGRPDAEHPNDGVIVTGITLSNPRYNEDFVPAATMSLADLNLEGAKLPRNVPGPQGQHRAVSASMTRGPGGGGACRRRGSNDSYISTDSQRSLKMPRRFSAPAITRSEKYEFRLGIRRALDLTGIAIEAFPKPPAASPRGAGSGGADGSPQSADEESAYYDHDEPDDLKKTAVLEQLIRAADIAAVLQDWLNMIKWSCRLFFEQKASSVQGRGVDPQRGWLKGQIAFIDSYALPLAKRLAESGVFGDGTGDAAGFAACVEDNRSRWLREGQFITDGLIDDWDAVMNVGGGNSKR